uniref:Translation initiation factor eIF2B subunit epsilon n=1 Tax=Haemonchus contortus TaxID=6289 RepID=A0A7I4Y979_HAECO
MPPKREHKKENDSLTGVIVVDSFDPRFAPFSTSEKPWCLFPICDVPLINFTLSWIARTEVQRLLLVVSERNVHSMEEVERDWKHCFESVTVVCCKNALNVGDAMRELDSRGLLTGDFLLVSNPATITSSTLKAQIAAFRQRRAENKNNVMTLIYSDMKTPKNGVVCIEKATKKLRAYHRKDDSTKLDIDKSFSVEEAETRQDIVDSGIALCSLNISAQFSDNFDFQHRDDVIREILVNEEILLQNIHVEVLPPYDAAFCVTDYDSLLLVNNLVMERWFHPLVLDRVIYQESCGFISLPGNIYVAVSKEENGKVSKQAFNVTLGYGCDIDDSVVMRCSSIGNGTKIGGRTRILNCIIGENCTIGVNCQMEESVLGDNVSIPDNTSLLKQSLISAKVTYPHGIEVPSNVAICSSAPHEDFEETVHCKQSKGVNIWSLASGGSFWAANGRVDVTNTSTGEENESATGTDSEGAEPIELDATAQFYEEVVESMERIQGLTFSDQQMHNLILEINSSKLAYNISMEDVAKNVFAAFLTLPGNETLTGLKELCQKWKLIFSNYYKPQKSQIQLLLAIEDHYKESPEEFGKMVTRLVHFLYNDMDILEEDAILEWADSLDENSELRRIMKPIVDWLEEESDEESDDE